MQKIYTPNEGAIQDSVTVLQCIEPHRANKIIRRNGEVEDFNAGSRFHHEAYPVSGIRDLAELLEMLEASAHHFVIRGQIRPSHQVGSWIHRRNVVFDEKPRHYLCVDTEGLQAPEGMSPTSDEAIELVVSHLPPELHGISFIAQFSSQAGTQKAGQVIRAHLWFWLDRPYRDSELKRWGQNWNELSGLGEKFIDVSLFQQVHAHYTAAPTFEDLSQDPLPNGRTRLIVRGRDFGTLKLPDTGWKPKKRAVPRSTTMAGVEHRAAAQAVAGDEGRLTDGREERARDIRFNTFLNLQKAGQLSLDRFSRESWEAFERECITTETAASSNIYTYEDWVIRCGGDFPSLQNKFGAPEITEPYFKTSPVRPEEAQAQVARAVAEFLADGESRIIRVTPGTGKTTEVAKQLAHHLPEGKVVHVFASTLKLCREWKALIDKEGTRVRVRIIEGRNETNCRRFDRVEAAGKAGVPVRSACCIKEVDEVRAQFLRQCGRGSELKQMEGKSGLFSVCPFYDECLASGYESQFKADADVYIFATKQLGIPKRKEIPAADFVIIDEQFISELSEITTIEFRKWHTAVPVDLCKLIDGALAGASPLLRTLRDAGWTIERLSHVVGALGEAIRIQMLDTHPHQAMAGWKKGNVPAAIASRKILKALRSELGLPRENSNKVRLVHNDVHVCELKDAGRTEASTLFLDGTANVELIQRVKPGVKLAQIDVERHARVVQVTSNKVGVGGFKEDVPDRARQLGRLQDLIDRYAESYERALIITYMLIKDELRVPRGWEIAHFGSVRGIDAWKDVEAVFVLGNWNKPLYVAEDMAAAVWGNSDEELSFSEKPNQEWRGYRMKAGREHALVSVHPDSRVQLCLEQMREAEGVQAIDRARLIWGNKRKDIYVVSSLPLDITVDKVIGLDGLAEGSPLEHVLVACDGVVPLSEPILCELLPDLFQNRRKAQAFIEGVRDGFKTPNSNISTLLGNGVLKTHFRKAGQAGGRATECLHLVEHPTAKASLEKLVGPLSYYDGPTDKIRSIKFQAATVDGSAPDPELLELVRGLERDLTPNAVRFKPPREWAMI